MYDDKKSLAAGYRRADTYCHDRSRVPDSVPAEARAMITVIVLTTVFVLFLVFGALVVRDVYRQASGWPEHRWTDTDDARLARLLDAGRR
jgi:hypothetical protein